MNASGVPTSGRQRGGTVMQLRFEARSWVLSGVLRSQYVRRRFEKRSYLRPASYSAPHAASPSATPDLSEALAVMHY